MIFIAKFSHTLTLYLMLWVTNMSSLGTGKSVKNAFISCLSPQIHVIVMLNPHYISILT